MKRKSMETTVSSPSSKIVYVNTKSALKPSRSFYLTDSPPIRIYEKQNLIGTGSEGETKVYAFKDADGDIKAVREESFDDPDEVKSCERAAEIYRQVNGYCEMVSVDNEDKTITTYTICDYINGKNLYEKLEETFTSPR